MEMIFGVIAATIVGFLVGMLVAIPPSKKSVTDESVASAVLEAYTYCGLPLDHYGPEFNLARTGKLQDVLLRAARAVDSDHQFETVQDVISVLSKGEGR